MKDIKEIYIIPALFIKYRDDGNILLKCLAGNIVENRAFESHLIKGIKNPKYLLIGIKISVGTMIITFIDGSEYEKLFKTKWKLLFN